MTDRWLRSPFPPLTGVRANKSLPECFHPWMPGHGCLLADHRLAETDASDPIRGSPPPCLLGLVWNARNQRSGCLSKSCEAELIATAAAFVATGRVARWPQRIHSVPNAPLLLFGWVARPVHQFGTVGRSGTAGTIATRHRRSIRHSPDSRQERSHRQRLRSPENFPRRHSLTDNTLATVSARNREPAS